MKEFHIISSGVSLLTNAQKSAVLPADVKIADENYWSSILDEPEIIKKVYNFLKSDPRKNSAELNTFLRVVEGKDPNNIEVYLFGTKTASNELCRRVIERFLKDKGFTIYTPYEVSGYFWEAKFDERFAVDEFKKGISELLDRLIYLAKKKIEKGYKVYFNPTGGLKAHVIATALAGFLTGCEIYYMNEEFNEVVFLPMLFYIPKGKEIELLEILSDKKSMNGDEFRRLKNEFNEEIERLAIYGLIELEEDELGNVYRIKITNKGFLILEEVKGR